MAKTVFVVDDDDNTRRFLTVALEENGYEAVTAADGEEAYNMLLEMTPDLILLDVMMPKKTGFSLFKQIRRKEASQHGKGIQTGRALLQPSRYGVQRFLLDAGDVRQTEELAQFSGLHLDFDTNLHAGLQGPSAACPRLRIADDRPGACKEGFSLPG